MLRYLMETREGLTQSSLADATGIVLSTISSVLNGKRSPTRGQIGTLAGDSEVSPAAFRFE